MKFYERRARRLLPALFFMMTISIPFALIWMFPAELKTYSQSLIAVTTFTANVYYFIQSEYFDIEANLKPLLHTWSLAVEEQYYIIFPIFLFVAWRFGLKIILIILISVFFLSLGGAEIFSNKTDWMPIAGFYLLQTRGWEILLGAFVAFYFFKYPKVLNSNFFSLLGMLLIVYSIFSFDKNTPYPSFYTLIPTMGTVLVLLFSSKGTILYKYLSKNILVGIGLVIYSAYLWHHMLFSFARIRFDNILNSSWMVLLGFISLFIAFFSYRYIELPFRRRNELDFFINKSNRFYLASFMVIFFVSLGFIGNKTKGFEDYYLNNRYLKMNPVF